MRLENRKNISQVQEFMLTKHARSSIMVSMNRLSNEDRAKVVAAICEGCSIRATVRLTGIAKNTIAKLLIELGKACTDYLNRTLVNLTCKRVQCDEIWSFIG